MYDKKFIITGIIIFLAVFTTPFWLNISTGKEKSAPKIEYPKDESACIRSKEDMRANHMDLLNEWRDKVVRSDHRFNEFNGKKFELSLSKTCMKCHDNKAQFCDRCHNYLDVVPYCWDCHTEPKGGKAPNE